MSDDSDTFNSSAENDHSASIIVMPLEDYPHSKSAICKSAYEIAHFRYKHPNVYSDYVSLSGVVNEGDLQEIYEMDGSFPTKPTDRELKEGFVTDELIFEISDGELGVIGVAVHSVNGSTFKFYLSQLMAFELFISHYFEEHRPSKIPMGFSLGDLN